MHTANRIVINADPELVYQAASQTTNWPAILPHYRYVTSFYQGGDVQVVEMSANRDFGAFRYPTWWSSIQWNEPTQRRVRYRHVGGITRGMEVVWHITPLPNGHVQVIIDHALHKRNPLVALFYELVVGRLFVMFIAQRTLEGVKRWCEERGARTEG
ncbi:MAG: SRPBCC family protein [Herpetosiphonaceae bacterium]|nr:SRPBCC family protein [Herpetosiphonaceae bacterium]